jgi:hypothetical protein
LLGSGSVNGKYKAMDFNDQNGNIVGALFQAVRLIYSIRDNYTFGACSFTIIGGAPGCLIPFGVKVENWWEPVTDKTSYIYWLYYYMIHNTGENIVGFSGTCPGFTGNAIHNIDDGSSGNVTYTGPLTPLMVTKSEDGKKLYITVVNGSSTTTVPFSAIINNFKASQVNAFQIQDNDVNQLFNQASNARFVKTPSITLDANTIRYTLPALSCTFISLSL